MDYNILERSNWTDNSEPIVVGNIIEYDIKDAGFSIIKENKLLPEYLIKYIQSIQDHQKRNEFIGKLRLKHQKYPKLKELEYWFKYYRIEFGKANRLSNKNIFSIKKDAVFTLKFCDELEFGNVKFVMKNSYYSCLCINRYEMYYDYEKLDVKGLGKKVILHKDFMVDIIIKFIRLYSSNDFSSCKRYIVETMEKYRFKKLDVGYYREFSPDSNYKKIVNGKVFGIDYVSINELTNEFDISYNYMKILVPMLNIITRY